MKRLLIALVRIYQLVFRCFPARCRFYPTCSNYTIEALRKHGIVHGLWLSIRRIGRCNPWNPGGVDFVPSAVATQNEVGECRQRSGNTMADKDQG